MAHVFISYVRENSKQVERLYDDLTKHGIKVWLDKNDIKPGYRWQDAIRGAIQAGDFFIACFSTEYNTKNPTYMNEELTLAIEQLRQRPHNQAWFIPVVFSGEVPDWNIGAGETLHSLQWIELDDANWGNGIQRIIEVIKPIQLVDLSQIQVNEKHTPIDCEIKSKIESAEYSESIGDVWQAASIYEKITAKLKQQGNNSLAQEMERRAKKNRSIAAKVLRGD